LPPRYLVSFLASRAAGCLKPCQKFLAGSDRLVSLPSAHHRPQSFLRSFRQAQAVDLPLELGRAAAPGNVTVESGRGGRADKVIRVRIDSQQFPGQVGNHAQIIFLVVVFRPMETGQGQNLGLDFLAQPPGRLVSGFLGQPFLLLVVIEDRSHVLPGPGLAGRVVAPPENFEQVLVGNNLGVIIDLNGFGMVPQAVIGRFGAGPA